MKQNQMENENLNKQTERSDFCLGFCPIRFFQELCHMDELNHLKSTFVVGCVVCLECVVCVGCV